MNRRDLEYYVPTVLYWICGLSAAAATIWAAWTLFPAWASVIITALVVAVIVAVVEESL